MIPSPKELAQIATDPDAYGLVGLELLATERVGLELNATASETPARKTDNESVVSVRAFLPQGRIGWASGPSSHVQRTIGQARAAAEGATPVAEAGPQRRPEPLPRGQGTDDPRHNQLTDEDRLEIFQTNARAAARGPATVGRFSYREARIQRRLATSAGVNLEGQSTLYEARGTVALTTPEGVIDLHERVAGCVFASVACLPIGSNLAQRALALSRDSVVLEGPVRVLLPPRAAAPLIDWVASQLMHPMLAKRQTALSRAIEHDLLSRKLHLVDDAAALGGERTRAFDDRGTAPRPLTMLAEGRVVGRYLDLETARQRGERPTGHAVGAGLRPANLLLHQGTRSINAWLGEQVVPVLEIDAMPNLSDQDALSGAIDVVVNGVVHLGHEVQGSARQVRLRGQLIDLLAGVAAVMSDTDRIGHVDAPGLLLDGFSAG